MMADKCSELPEDEDLEFCKLGDALAFVQKLGCIGASQHVITNEYHRLCLAVLRWAVDNVGETFPEVLRGVRSERSDSEHLILFGTRDRQVAEFYGSTIKTYRNVRGIKTYSCAKSVKNNAWSELDEEIIFFP